MDTIVNPVTGSADQGAALHAFVHDPEQLERR